MTRFLRRMTALAATSVGRINRRTLSAPTPEQRAEAQMGFWGCRDKLDCWLTRQAARYERLGTQAGLLVAAELRELATEARILDARDMDEFLARREVLMCGGVEKHEVHAAAGA